jgi:ABC-type amino acid transport system permease subunit
MMHTATITATRIALLLIFIQAAIGFTNGIGLFSHDYIKSPDNEFTKYTIQDVNKYNSLMGTNKTTSWATLVQISQAFLDGLPLAGKILFSIGVIFPTLVNSFGIDPFIAGFFQLGIWCIYTLAIAEIITGREFLW